MCGIAGILFSKDSLQQTGKRLLNMQKVLAHRGPDGQGSIILPSASLLHTRLALVDVEGGAQPFTDNEIRYHLVFNGEIYNHNLLRDELSDFYRFKTHSDTEVLLAAFIKWGEECLYKLEGMFAFLIWDNLTQTAFAARDPLGVKPFVYNTYNGEFIFASETKAILKGWKSKAVLNEYALSEFLIMPSFSGVRYSLFEGVKHLHAGEKMFITKDYIKVSSYYTYKVGHDLIDLDNCINRLSTSIHKSVKHTIKADFPVGSFFSGGLDSSLLTSIASMESKDPLTCFNIRFIEHEGIEFSDSSIVISDDKPFAEKLAKSLNINLIPVMVGQDSILDSLEELSRTNDRMNAWEQELSQHFLSMEACKHVKSVLVGDAADETHFGYFFLLDDKANYSPYGLMKFCDTDMRQRCLSDDLQKRVNPVRWLCDEYTNLAKSGGYVFGGSREDNIRASTYLIVKLWLGRLLHNGDIHTMKHGIEGRVPLANISVVEAASSIHPLHGFKGNVEKYCLRQASRPYLPDYIYNRKKSALPRDPRLGFEYQKILLKLIEENYDFGGQYLNLDEIKGLCYKKVLTENQRILVFNLISAFYWWRCYIA